MGKGIIRKIGSNKPPIPSLALGRKRQSNLRAAWAVMAVLSDRRTVTEVAGDWEVSRQTVHSWLARYEREAMEGMGNRSHRPTTCPHQMPGHDRGEAARDAAPQALLGPRRLALELARKGVTPTPSPSAIYRSLLRAGLVQPMPRRVGGCSPSADANR